jgi:hypothetical protein
MIIFFLESEQAAVALDKVILVSLSPLNFSQNKVAGFDWRRSSKSTMMPMFNK